MILGKFILFYALDELDEKNENELLELEDAGPEVIDEDEKIDCEDEELG